MGKNSTDNEIPEYVLLDISMFMLDFLDPKRIKQNYKQSSIILEVPSAFVTMIWAAKADLNSENGDGEKILTDFIFANLTGIKNNELHKNSTNEQIQQIVNANDIELHRIAKEIHTWILDEFVPLIEGADKKKKEGNENNNIYIRRYEPVLAISNLEQIDLRSAYKKKLNLKAHPLYDLYYLQVHHAQSIGIAASERRTRSLLSTGRATFDTLKKWKGDFRQKWEERKYITSDRKILNEISRDYFSENWGKIAIGVMADITLSTALPGGGLVLAAATAGASASASILIDLLEKISGLPLANILAGIFIIPFTIYVCTLSLKWIRGLPILLATSITATSTLTATSFEANPFVFTPNFTPTFQATEFPVTSTPLWATQITITPIPAVVVSPIYDQNPNYCYYVVQPGDTLQSIASWFTVSIDAIRASDSLVNWGAFTNHQMIRVPANCCKPVGNNGKVHFVIKGDNVFRLAINYQTTIDKIVYANHLDNSRYIQNGQMLCIPNP